VVSARRRLRLDARPAGKRPDAVRRTRLGQQRANWPCRVPAGATRAAYAMAARGLGLTRAGSLLARPDGYPVALWNEAGLPAEFWASIRPLRIRRAA
jgi:hypothetical protein